MTIDDLVKIIRTAGKGFEGVDWVKSLLAAAGQFLNTLPESTKQKIKSLRDTDELCDHTIFGTSTIFSSGYPKPLLTDSRNRCLLEDIGVERFFFLCCISLKHTITVVEEFSLPRFIEQELEGKGLDSNGRMAVWGLVGREACIIDFERLSFLTEVAQQQAEIQKIK